MSLSKDPANKSTYIRPLFYTSAARLSFKAILENIGFNQKDFIFLPAYIGITDREGSGVLDPIEELRLKFDFYPLDASLSIDYEELLKKATQKKPKAILVIHYFGFFQKNILKLRKFCSNQKIILIEDCAHAFDSAFRQKPDSLAGHVGDYAFYSIHKYLPVKDGGICISKKQFTVNKSRTMSNISYETLLQTQISDYDSIRSKRRSNYNYLLSLLKKDDKKYSILFNKLDAFTVPLNFPVLIHNRKREKLYFKLIDHGIPAIALYYRLIKQIKKEEYPLSHSISESILNLPIHQDIECKDIKSIVTIFHSLLKNEI